MGPVAGGLVAWLPCWYRKDLDALRNNWGWKKNYKVVQHTASISLPRSTSLRLGKFISLPQRLWVHCSKNRTIFSVWVGHCVLLFRLLFCEQKKSRMIRPAIPRVNLVILISISVDLEEAICRTGICRAGGGLEARAGFSFGKVVLRIFGELCRRFC